MEYNKKPFLSFIGLILLLFCGIDAANAQRPQQIAKKALASTVLLVMEDANGQPLSLGSGFFVRNGQVATNLHVLKGTSRGYAKLVGQKTKYDIEGITAVDAERDLVILKISVPGAQVISFGDSDTVQIGTLIYAVGNPRGLEGTFSQGIISSIRKVGTDKILQLTAPISPGSSGGPVLNNNGQVIGVSVATFRGGQNLNFAIPSNYLKKLMEQIGPVKPLSQEKSAESKRSLLDDLGGNSDEGVSGGKFLWAEAPSTWGTSYSGEYTFSLRNQLRKNVGNVYCFVIFYDKQEDPIEVDVVLLRNLIPAGLAKRVTSEVGKSVQLMTTRGNSKTPYTKVEFRILDFEIIE
ncbi:MAG: S1C family serine protease [Candidatus Poribacteria bacterium]|nr:S1C family serine protease [Candidatus Poribacteria bacterium]